MRQILSPFLRDDGPLIIVMSRRSANVINGIEQQDRDELYFCSQVPAKQIAASVSLRFANPREQLRFQQRFVRIGMLWLRVTVPDSRNHAFLPNCYHDIRLRSSMMCAT